MGQLQSQGKDSDTHRNALRSQCERCDDDRSFDSIAFAATAFNDVCMGKQQRQVAVKKKRKKFLELFQSSSSGNIRDRSRNVGFLPVKTSMAKTLSSPGLKHDRATRRSHNYSIPNSGTHTFHQPTGNAGRTPAAFYYHSFVVPSTQNMSRPLHPCFQYTLLASC
jgi:hypothetical protein